MSYSLTFLLVKILVFAALSAVQIAVYRKVAAGERTRHPGSGRNVPLAIVFLIANLPGVYAALGTHIAIPTGLYTTGLAVYGFWQIGGLLLLAGGFLDRLIEHRRIRAEQPGGDRAEQTPVPEDAPVDLGRRSLIVRGGQGLIFVSSAPLFGFRNDEDFEIERHDVTIPNLPARLKGLRIAMLADIHSGPFMEAAEIRRYIDAVNALAPDMVFLPGDFVQNRDEEVEPVCESVRLLHPPFGVYGCTGNHEYFADADHVARELSNAGVRMLRNEHLVLEPRGEKLALIGIDDVRRDHPFDAQFRVAADGLSKSIPNILLCHKPYYLEEAAGWGVNLMVSGHTHGGQIVLARILDAVITPAALISGYIAGFYESDATQLYVTRGIGMVGIPVRINCPPEITVFTLG